MNTLSILDEMWAESMESIQLTMSGYFLCSAVCVSGVENEARHNGTVVISEQEDNTPTWGPSSHEDDGTLTLKTFLGYKIMTQ